jgi:hypothetical protein
MKAGPNRRPWTVAFVIRAEWVIVRPALKQTATQPVQVNRNLVHQLEYLGYAVTLTSRIATPKGTNFMAGAGRTEAVAR